MKIQRYSFFLLLSVLGLASACQQTPAEPSSNSMHWATDGPQRPADDWYLARSWPDGELSFRTYYRAMQRAKREALQKGDSPGFDQMWTTAGPGNIGARINTIAIHPENDNIILVGYARGGLWRTTNGGLDWLPVFDEQAYLAIADITFDAQHPDTIYVGTGDPNISGYPAIGDGLWRSTDGGDSWENVGPEGLNIVSHIRLKPDDPQTIFLATMGIPFERNDERGLYRSTDGGVNWEQILFVSEQAGIIDLAIHPDNPNVLFAASWDRIRNNQESTADGPDAKVWRSTDAGNTWEVLSNGLPTDEQSRIGLAIAPSNAEHIYAAYTGTDYNLHDIYESLDGGDTWQAVLDTMSNSQISPFALGGFGWYFGKIRVHPENEDDIYILGVDLWRSEDGGTNWEQAAPPWWSYDVHADKHDMVWNSQGEAFLATDGGLYRSADSMQTWQDAENIPTTQFYRVAVNPHDPTFYYGGAQDNGSTGGATLQQEWERIYGGDGFQMAFHPEFSEIFFAETQNGRINITYDGGFEWQSAVDSIDSDDRRNWDMPYFLSVHDSWTMYTGTYRVYQSLDLGGDWEAISPDLTDGLVLHPRHHTITTVHESPIVAGLLYVGTTDGNVWRKDQGENTWTPIYDQLPDRYVSEVKASPTFDEYVYVSHSAYKDNDFQPYFYRSTDRGDTWASIAGNLPNLSINDFYILPNHADSILFVATDGGVYGTIDRGENWERLGNNFPFVPVYDLEYDPSDEELIAGTFARSIMSYPLDSLVNGMPPITGVSQVAALPGNWWLSPNPGQDNVRLHWQGADGVPTQVSWYNAQGQLLGQEQLGIIATQAQQQLSLPNVLPAGIYYIQVVQNGKLRSMKWVKG